MADIVSTIPKVTDDLIAAVNAKLMTDGYGPHVTCHDGLPAEWPDEAIVIGGVEEDEERWASLGRLKREESYGLQFWISVVKPGDSQKEARDRAFTLLGVLATVLRENPHIGNAANSLTAELRPRRYRPGPSGEGRLAEIHGVVFVDHARI